MKADATHEKEEYEYRVGVKGSLRNGGVIVYRSSRGQVGGKLHFSPSNILVAWKQQPGVRSSETAVRLNTTICCASATPTWLILVALHPLSRIFYI